MGPKKSVEVKFFTGAFLWGALNVIDDHFSLNLAHFPNIVGALRYSSSFSMQKNPATQNMKMGALNVNDDVERAFFTHFHVL